MKDFLAWVWTMFMVLAFVFVCFGIWGSWTMICGVIVGFVNMIFTEKNR